MKITMERKDDLNAVLNIHLVPADYKPQVDEEVKKYAKKASMPGFRPGKVPKGMVRKMLGLSVVMEQVTQVVSKAISEHIRDEKLHVLGDPMPVELKSEDDFDLNCEKNIDFNFDLALAPEFELGLELKDAVVKYDVVVDDKTVDEEVRQLRDRHGELTYPDEVIQGDMVFGKINIKGQENAGDGEDSGKLVVINEARLEEAVDAEAVYKPLIGKKVKDTLDFDLGLFGDEDLIKKGLMLEDEEYARFSGKDLSLEIRRISRNALAELNEEFFEKVLPGEEIKDEDAMRESIRQKLATDFERAASYRFNDEARKALLKAHDLPLPDDLLKRWMIHEYEQVTEENVDDEYKEMADSIRWSLIIEKIQEQYPETKVEQADLDEEIEKSIEGILGGVDDPALAQQYKQYIMGNEEMLRNHYGRILNERLFGVLEQKVPVQSEKIDSTAFLAEK
ncbi:MAG: trigger factor [Bacteroidia bacterium]